MKVYFCQFLLDITLCEGYLSLPAFLCDNEWNEEEDQNGTLVE
jgi:hypothetical protein